MRWFTRCIAVPPSSLIVRITRERFIVANLENEWEPPWDPHWLLQMIEPFGRRPCSIHIAALHLLFSVTAAGRGGAGDHREDLL